MFQIQKLPFSVNFSNDIENHHLKISSDYISINTIIIKARTKFKL